MTDLDTPTADIDDYYDADAVDEGDPVVDINADTAETVTYDAVATNAAVESAVANYVDAIRRPDSLRNDEAIQALSDKLADTTDPLEALQLRQQILTASTITPDTYADAFIVYAKSWADEQTPPVTAAAFQAEGVPAHVLTAAGFRNVTGQGPSPKPRKPRNDHPRVTRGDAERRIADAVNAAVEFTAGEIIAASGVSQATVRKWIVARVNDGQLVEAGVRPAVGVGRSAKLYQHAQPVG